jgi:hypothetical protein
MARSRADVEDALAALQPGGRAQGVQVRCAAVIAAGAIAIGRGTKLALDRLLAVYGLSLDIQSDL